jgi:hypothetical protein
VICLYIFLLNLFIDGIQDNLQIGVRTRLLQEEDTVFSQIKEVKDEKIDKKEKPKNFKIENEKEKEEDHKLFKIREKEEEKLMLKKEKLEKQRSEKQAKRVLSKNRPNAFIPNMINVNKKYKRILLLKIIIIFLILGALIYGITSSLIKLRNQGGDKRAIFWIILTAISLVENYMIFLPIFCLIKAYLMKKYGPYHPKKFTCSFKYLTFFFLISDVDRAILKELKQYVKNNKATEKEGRFVENNNQLEIRHITDPADNNMSNYKEESQISELLEDVEENKNETSIHKDDDVNEFKKGNKFDEEKDNEVYHNNEDMTKTLSRLKSQSSDIKRKEINLSERKENSESESELSIKDESTVKGIKKNQTKESNPKNYNSKKEDENSKSYKSKSYSSKDEEEEEEEEDEEYNSKSRSDSYESSKNINNTSSKINVNTKNSEKNNVQLTSKNNVDKLEINKTILSSKNSNIIEKESNSIPLTVMKTVNELERINTPININNSINIEKENNSIPLTVKKTVNDPERINTPMNINNSINIEKENNNKVPITSKNTNDFEKERINTQINLKNSTNIQSEKNNNLKINQSIQLQEIKPSDKNNNMNSESNNIEDNIHFDRLNKFDDWFNKFDNTPIGNLKKSTPIKNVKNITPFDDDLGSIIKKSSNFDGNRGMKGKKK